MTTWVELYNAQRVLYEKAEKDFEVSTSILTRLYQKYPELRAELTEEFRQFGGLYIDGKMIGGKRCGS